MTDRFDPEWSPGPWLPKLREPRLCLICGARFRSPEPTRKYCSALCREKAERARLQRRKHGGPSKIDISPPKKD